MDYKDISVVYEDNHILVAVKPQNVPVQADSSGDDDMLSMLKKYLQEKYDKPGEAYLGLVQRLDRPTGGVMVFAKTSKAAARLCKAITDGEVDKKYLAVVYGVPKDRQAHLSNYLKKDPASNVVSVVPMLTEGAKRAELDYKLLCSDEGGRISLVMVKLYTGRSHQIRVQMANIGHPLVGDVKYAGSMPKANCNLALWATELRFKHPVKDAQMVFRVYPPEDEKPWKYFNVDTFLSEGRK